MKYSFQGKRMVVTVKSEIHPILKAIEELAEFEDMGWVNFARQNVNGNRVYYYDYVGENN